MIPCSGLIQKRTPAARKRPGRCTAAGLLVCGCSSVRFKGQRACATSVAGVVWRAAPNGLKLPLDSYTKGRRSSRATEYKKLSAVWGNAEQRCRSFSREREACGERSLAEEHLRSLAAPLSSPLLAPGGALSQWLAHASFLRSWGGQWFGRVG